MILVKCDCCDFLDELISLFGRRKKKSLSLFTGPIKVDVKFKLTLRSCWKASELSTPVHGFGVLLVLQAHALF